MDLPAFRHVNYAERRVDIDRRDDGSLVLRNPHPIGEAATNLIEPLRKWAVEAADRVWLGMRKKPIEGQAYGDWETVTYAQANDRVDALAQGMLDRGLSQEAPLMILSGNSIEHALMTYAAILAGAPAVPVSPAYSLMSTDYDKLKYVFELIQPKMIFVQDSTPYQKALSALNLEGVTVVACEGPCDITYDALVATAKTSAVDDSYNQLNWDMVAKFLFTSGSTGMPKAVITTHRMMCVNSVMGENLIVKDEDEEPPVLLNWLPWNHCFGGNAVLNNLLTAGGTLYIDGGRPVGKAFDETVQNLREIAPTTYSTVPAAYGLLVPALEQDEVLAKNFFSKVKFLSYGGAALAQDLYDRLQKVSIATIGERMILSSGYGATETAPTIMNVHWETDRMGLLGLPLPGIEIKLVPTGSKMEVRVKGDCITPGYFKNPEKTADAYDEEGFYKLGDAAKFVNPDDPSEGLVFDGRVVEDFKLATGTWVSAGRLRVQAVESSGGLLADALVAGLDKAYVGILGFPNVGACQACVGDHDMAVDELVRHPKVLETLAEGLRFHNETNPGSSTRIKRALLMVEPPSVDKGELTDKGYINQSTALSRRADLVDKLYAETPGNDVVVL
jgi:feruloyl-CoA synthase